jgi:hypothetical protein
MGTLKLKVVHAGEEGGFEIAEAKTKFIGEPSKTGNRLG